jgi:hypothetical protein
MLIDIGTPDRDYKYVVTIILHEPQMKDDIAKWLRDKADQLNGPVYPKNARLHLSVREDEQWR